MVLLYCTLVITDHCIVQWAATAIVLDCWAHLAPALITAMCRASARAPAVCAHTPKHQGQDQQPQNTKAPDSCAKIAQYSLVAWWGCLPRHKQPWHSLEQSLPSAWCVLILAYGRLALAPSNICGMNYQPYSLDYGDDRKQAIVVYCTCTLNTAFEVKTQPEKFMNMYKTKELQMVPWEQHNTKPLLDS